MLTPSQFQVNDAWIIFKLNTAPVRTKADGDFDCIGLMDAASCFMLGTTFIPLEESKSMLTQIQDLLKKGQMHKQQLPKILLISSEEHLSGFADEAQRQNITISTVPLSQLLIFIAEAKDSFNKQFV